MQLWLSRLFQIGGLLTLAVLGTAATRVQAEFDELAESHHDDLADLYAGVERSQSPTFGAVNSSLRLAPYRLHDPMVEADAFQMLVPHGWQARGGMEWRHNAANLAVCNLSLVEPSGQRAVSYFPCDAFCSGEHLAMYGFAEGSQYLGNEVKRPLSTFSEYVAQVILPRYRRLNSSYRITQVEEMPAIAQAVEQSSAEPGMQKQVIAARVRIEYQQATNVYEEDFYGTLTYSSSANLPGFLLWGPERLYSFRAPRGQLDKDTPVFQAMISSMTIDLTWFHKYRQVSALWAQRVQNSIRDAGMLSRYIAQINDEITQINRDAWEYQQRSMDRVNRQFSNYIRGVEEYQNPLLGSTIQLPAGYQHVWVNRFQEYYLSNSPSFNPNQQSSQEWTELTRVP